jgi:hypothetical protein
MSTYAWTGPNGFTSSLQNPSITNAALVNAGAYTLTVTDSNNCTNSASTTVVVNAGPTATASNAGPYCIGQTIQLTGGPDGMSSYAWTGPNGFTSSLQNPSIPSAALINAGAYTLTVTDSNNCTDIDSTTVFVNVGLTATASNSGPYCVGQTIQLTGGPGGMSSYAWTGPNGYSSAVQSPSITNAMLAHAGSYTLTATNASGCTNTASTTVVVNDNPVATASNSGPYCVGNTIQLTGGPGGMSTYAWTGPNGFTSSVQSPSITNSALSNAGSYTLTVTNASGCTNAASTTVVVNAGTTATATNAGPYCIGQTIQLTGGPGGMSSYAWTGPNGFTSPLQNPSISGAAVANLGTYVLTVRNASGCYGSASTLVIVNPPPSTVASNSGPYCEGQAIQLTGGPNGMVSYSWTGPGGFTSTLQSPAIPDSSTTNAGTYTLIAVAAGGCSNSASTTVTVNPGPSATASNTGPYWEGQTIQLNGGPSGMASYQWIGPGGFTSTSQNPTIPTCTVINGGSYDLTIMNSGGCSGSASTVVFVNSSRADQFSYYGVAPHNFDCSSGSLTDVTRMVITGISDGTTYTVTDLTTSTVVTSGAVNRGQQSVISTPTHTLIDTHKYKMASNKPAQAYMGYDCSGTLPGSMFFLSDNGVTEYGRSFTVPLADFSDDRMQYWVFAKGAGTVEVRTLAGALVASNTFAALGAWQIPSASLTINTVYAITSSSVDFAVQQSSQNTATEVPPTTQTVASGDCSVKEVGRSFLFQAQPYGGNNTRIAVFPYASGHYTVTRLDCGGGTAVDRDITVGTLSYRSLDDSACAYQVTSTVDIAIAVGSTEGSTTNVYDLGDDAIYLRGTGSEVRGHAMRCGGTIFAGQDGTTVSGSGGTFTPTLPRTLNADGFVEIAGNSSNNTLFDVTTQDAQHTILAEVVGGNCDVQLNDWSKVMRPLSLSRPMIIYPSSAGWLNSLTPTVTGTAVPGSTVTLKVYDAGPPVNPTPVFTGTGTTDTSGFWSILVTPALTENHLYDLEAVQGIPGVCPVNPNPSPGTSGSQGRVDSVRPSPPTIATPADGNRTSNHKPAFTGTAEANSTVKLYIDGSLAVILTADGSGNWSYTPTTDLTNGQHTAYATSSDAAGNTSLHSTTHTFTIYTVGLLRNASVTQLAPQVPPNGAIFVAQYPVDPALSPPRDLSVPNFTTGASYSYEYEDATNAGAVLIFYQLEGNSGNTLRVTKTGGKVVVTF